MTEPKHHLQPQESAENKSAAKPAGRPPAIDDYECGKLLMCLALGFTQREAAMFAGVGRTSVQTSLKQEEFNEDLKHSTDLVRLYPLLRMYQAAGESWRVAARLLVELDAQFGELTTDELIEGMSLMLEQVHAARRASDAAGS